MPANTYDFQSLGPVGGGTAEHTSGTSAKDSAVAAGGSGASISPGDLCIYINGYWAKLANGEANADGRYGIARSTSTETASVDGLVDVEFAPQGLKVKGRATTPASLVQGVLGDKVTLDVSAGVQKVDQSDTTNGRLLIVDYDTSVSGSETVTVVLPWTAI